VAPQGGGDARACDRPVLRGLRALALREGTGWVIGGPPWLRC
jgi:hypothetical protein